VKLTYFVGGGPPPADLVVRVPEVVPGFPDRILPRDEECAKDLKKRTLTKLYNQRPAGLGNIHRELDAAVAAAYGWPADLTDEQILERLFALNPGPSRRQPGPRPRQARRRGLNLPGPPRSQVPPPDFRLRRRRGHRVPRSHGPPERNVNPNRLTHRWHPSSHEQHWRRLPAPKCATCPENRTQSDGDRTQIGHLCRMEAKNPSTAR